MYVCLSVCLSDCLSDYLSVYLSVCQTVFLPLFCLAVFLCVSDSLYPCRSNSVVFHLLSVILYIYFACLRTCLPFCRYVCLDLPTCLFFSNSLDVVPCALGPYESHADINRHLLYNRSGNPLRHLLISVLRFIKNIRTKRIAMFKTSYLLRVVSFPRSFLLVEGACEL